MLRKFRTPCAQVTREFPRESSQSAGALPADGFEDVIVIIYLADFSCETYLRSAVRLRYKYS